MASSPELRKKKTSFPTPPHSIIPDPQCSNAAKTQRLTENKRRYRARRKEYVLDLESKLAEARETGIQATKEVQQAACQVVLENGRLRELLRLVGFADEEIDVWAGCGGNGDRANCGRQLEIEQLARRVGTFAASQKNEDASGKQTLTPGSVSESGGGGTPHCTMEPSQNKPSSPDPSDPRAAAAGRDPTAASEEASISEPEVESVARHGEVPSCKLLTRLAENPAADITMVPAPLDSGELPQGAACDGDIECRKAYDMLIPYAVSEEKMDYVARALEGGCKAKGNGGCAVKSNVILQALDHMLG
ncbi:hypothetical protein B0T21DRAFT_359714 [Apiosordaria backusii]|uniref:BZIP domain-containing protein n=1 Tax=Apiosordaria backusii TaxID=314023 RepID=A0AA40ELQ2_9PEZI|nr:hypothetical protein B0T21DRAFT_359714 [Apiosordaria backusii]